MTEKSMKISFHSLLTSPDTDTPGQVKSIIKTESIKKELVAGENKQINTFQYKMKLKTRRQKR